MFNLFTEELHEQFLGALERTGLYTASSDAVGCDPNAALDYRQTHPEFQVLCDQALTRYGEEIILEARRRAVEGIDKAIIGGKDRDRVVHTEKQYSDRLLELFLKRGKDGSFREKTDITVSGAMDFKSEMDLSKLSTRARAKLRDLLDVITEDDANRALGKEVD